MHYQRRVRETPAIAMILCTSEVKRKPSVAKNLGSRGQIGCVEIGDFPDPIRIVWL